MVSNSRTGLFPRVTPRACLSSPQPGHPVPPAHPPLVNKRGSTPADLRNNPPTFLTEVGPQLPLLPARPARPAPNSPEETENGPSPPQTARPDPRP